MEFKKNVLVLAFALFTLAASAQTATPVVKDRQETQQKRIENGVKEGDLNRKETAKLEHEQKNINRAKKRAKADGKVTKKEKAKLHARQDKASRDIKRAKHN